MLRPQKDWLDRAEAVQERRTPGDRRLEVLDLRNPRTGETVRDTLLRIERRRGGDRRAEA